MYTHWNQSSFCSIMPSISFSSSIVISSASVSLIILFSPHPLSFLPLVSMASIRRSCMTLPFILFCPAFSRSLPLLFFLPPFLFSSFSFFGLHHICSFHLLRRPQLQPHQQSFVESHVVITMLPVPADRSFATFVLVGLWYLSCKISCGPMIVLFIFCLYLAFQFNLQRFLLCQARIPHVLSQLLFDLTTKHKQILPQG